MGGKNAIIVDADADLDEAVRGRRRSAFGYAGQKCSACSRVIVLEAAYDDFVRAARRGHAQPARRPRRGPGNARRPPVITPRPATGSAATSRPGKARGHD